LADLFLDVAERRHLQLIIESHSEHVLGRLQRRIGEAKTDFVTPDNIKLYFCQPGEAGSLVQPVEADRFGQIRNWPSNFFGDLAGDLDKMMDAGLERRRQELTAGG
jgi:predicted ATPase